MALFADRFLNKRTWAPNWLAFSHGRAALAWLIKRKKLRSALLCAYTCPSLPAFLRHIGVDAHFFDAGAGPDEIAAQAGTLPRPCLVLVPALFGSPPWCDAAKLAKALGRSAIVVIDAAQTAFGHCDFAPPPGGATLSCPRKTTALADGAVLALGRGLASERSVDQLPIAAEASAWKHAARALWATRRPDLELQAVDFNRRSEEAWPNAPHRMSDESRLLLERMDAAWHRSARRRNRRTLAAALAGRVPVWAADRGTPFSLPVFVSEPDELIARLRVHRIYANRLWPDAEHEPAPHLAAAYLVRYLVSLPLDQQHSDADMEQIAAAVLQAKPLAAPPPPAALRHMIRL
jgi:hypothetical protein